MCAVISTNDGRQYQTPGRSSQAGAIIAGSMAGGMVSIPFQFRSLHLINKMKMMNKGLDTVELRNAVNKALDSSGMRAKGVELINPISFGEKPIFDFPFGFSIGGVKEAAGNTVDNIILKVIPIPSDLELKKALLTEMPAKLRRTRLGEIYISYMEDTLTKGNNACYLPKANKVVVNIRELGTAAFHEIGHAMNRNASKFWKVMQKSRTPSLLFAGAVPIIALFKRKKVEGEEPKNVVDKATTFIKNNCGVLTTAAFVPVVAEELKATQRGNKLAKQLLSPEIYKKVVKTNRIGAATYIMTGLVAGGATFVGSYVRDLCSKPKKINQGVKEQMV